MMRPMVTASDADGSVRLNHLLAQLGVASRRACDVMIAEGRVRIDGRVVREPGARVIPGAAIIEVNGARIGTPPRRIVLILNKPKGFVSTVADPEGRPTVLDLCRGVARRQRLFPVGRLDVNTTGALLVTNDGPLCYRLTHPRFGIPRVYHLRVRGRVDDSQVRRLERMANDESGPAHGSQRPRGRPQRKTRAVSRPASRPSVEIVKQLPKEAVLKITLLEGRNRQVRKMCEAVGLRVLSLKRVSFGPVSVRQLPLGAVRPLTKREIERLETATGGPDGGR